MSSTPSSKGMSPSGFAIVGRSRYIEAILRVLPLRSGVHLFVVLRLQRVEDHVQPPRAGTPFGAVQPREPAVPAGSRNAALLLARGGARLQPRFQVVGHRGGGLHGVGLVPLAARPGRLDGGEAL